MVAAGGLRCGGTGEGGVVADLAQAVADETGGLALFFEALAGLEPEIFDEFLAFRFSLREAEASERGLTAGEGFGSHRLPVPDDRGIGLGDGNGERDRG